MLPHSDNEDMARVPGQRSVKRTETEIRKAIVFWGMRYYKFRKRILYSQQRPTQMRWPRLTTRLDCSGLVACCMKKAKVRPNVDWRYTNTWIQINFGHEVSYESARPGDVVFYGTSRSNPTHEALYLGNGQVLSMGHYPMGIYSIDYRSDRVMIRSFL